MKYSASSIILFAAALTVAYRYLVSHFANWLSSYLLARDSNGQGKFLAATFVFIVEQGINFKLKLIKKLLCKVEGIPEDSETVRL